MSSINIKRRSQHTRYDITISVERYRTLKNPSQRKNDQALYYNNLVTTPSPCKHGKVRVFNEKKTPICEVHTFVFPSRNNNFIPSLINSGRDMNSKCTTARSPVRNMPCGWSILIIFTVCLIAPQ